MREVEPSSSDREPGHDTEQPHSRPQHARADGVSSSGSVAKVSTTEVGDDDWLQNFEQDLAEVSANVFESSDVATQTMQPQTTQPHTATTEALLQRVRELESENRSLLGELQSAREQLKVHENRALPEHKPSSDEQAPEVTATDPDIAQADTDSVHRHTHGQDAGPDESAASRTAQQLQFVHDHLAAIKESEADLVEKQVSHQLKLQRLHKKETTLKHAEFSVAKQQATIDAQQQALAEKATSLKKVMAQLRRSQSQEASRLKRAARAIARRETTVSNRESQIHGREQCLAEALEGVATREHALKTLETQITAASNRLEQLLAKIAATAKGDAAVSAAPQESAGPNQSRTNQPSSAVSNAGDAALKQCQNMLGDGGRPVLRLTRPSPSFIRRCLNTERK